jgi:hypothetical protein
VKLVWVVIILTAFMSGLRYQPTTRPLRLAPEIKIDGATESLVNVDWLLVARDGRIAVQQGRDRAIKMYDSTGKLLRSFGRAGQGPGEFMVLAPGGWLGDSLWVYDPMSARVTIASPSLVFARQISIATIRPPAAAESRWPSSNSIQPLAVYGDGSLLVVANVEARSAPALYDTSGLPLFRVTAGGEIRAHVAHLPDMNAGLVRVRGLANTISMRTPFYAFPIYKVSPSATRIAILRANYGRAGQPSFTLIQLGGLGDTLFTRSYSFRSVSLPRRIADSALTTVAGMYAEMGKYLSETAARAMSEALRDQMRVPPYYPPFNSLLLSDDGTCMVGIPASPGVPARFMLIDSIGNEIGRGELPERMTPMVATRTRLWGVVLDADDLPSVVRYRIVN